MVAWPPRRRVGLFDGTAASVDVGSRAPTPNSSYTMSAWVSLSDASRPATLIEASDCYANDTKSRVPVSDWYDTGTASSLEFIARRGVGGAFSLMARVRAGTL